MPSAQQTIDDLRELVDEEEECLDSNLRRFEMKEDDDGKVYLEGEYTRTNDNLRSVENQKPVLVCLCNITNIRNEVKQQALWECRVVAEKLVEEIEDRFEGYNKGIYNSMNWFDPMHWTAEKDFGASDLSEFASHFEKPLQAPKFDLKRALRDKGMECFQEVRSLQYEGNRGKAVVVKHLGISGKGIPKFVHFGQADGGNIRIKFQRGKGLQHFEAASVRQAIEHITHIDGNALVHCCKRHNLDGKRKRRLAETCHIIVLDEEQEKKA